MKRLLRAASVMVKVLEEVDRDPGSVVDIDRAELRRRFNEARAELKRAVKAEIEAAKRRPN